MDVSTAGGTVSRSRSGSLDDGSTVGGAQIVALEGRVIPHQRGAVESVIPAAKSDFANAGPDVFWDTSVEISAIAIDYLDS